MTSNNLIKGALTTGAINAIINGLINWFTSDKDATILLTADSITSGEHTVFASAVPLAISLAFILSSVAFFSFKMDNKPKYFPTIFKLAIKHSIYALGIIVVFAVLLQKYFGSISVSPQMGSIIAGIIAGIVAGVVDYETKSRLIDQN